MGVICKWVETENSESFLSPSHLSPFALLPFHLFKHQSAISEATEKTNQIKTKMTSKFYKQVTVERVARCDNFKLASENGYIV